MTGGESSNRQRGIKTGMKASSWSVVRRLIFVFVPLVVVLVIAEFAARSYVAALPYHRGFFRTRGTNPAYTRKPWFSTDFLTSAITQPGGHYTPTGTSLILPGDYQDEYFKVYRGVRQTTGAVWTPDLGTPVHLVMIGGSTVYCSEVPDEFTLPSQLQSQLAALPETHRVIGRELRRDDGPLEAGTRTAAMGDVPRPHSAGGGLLQWCE